MSGQKPSGHNGDETERDNAIGQRTTDGMTKIARIMLHDEGHQVGERPFGGATVETGAQNPVSTVTTRTGNLQPIQR